MAIDFWAAQRRARKKTTLLLVLFALLTLLVSGLIEAALRVFYPEYQEVTPYPVIGFIFAAMTVIIAAFQYLLYFTGGGGSVATSLGAYKVDPTTTNSKERMLLNIVEEMAVAAHLPVPPVYLMDVEQINAFAAGLSPDDAAITVTWGALEVLSRDELQGVVAHEFGHIANGDMVIGIRLAALLMGFFFILYTGLRIVQFASCSNRQDNNRRGNPILLIAFLFVLGGSITWFFGSILKAAVSRQREYLADASAVQYTRNPDGIAGALRKIAKSTVSDMPPSGDALSHLYFDDRSVLSSLFQTHPPIWKRIAVLEGKDKSSP